MEQRLGRGDGVALLPRMSVAVQKNDRAEQQTAMDEAIGFSLALCLPAAAALVGMPYFLIDGLFTRGEFHAYDAHATARRHCDLLAARKRAVVKGVSW